MKITVIGIGFAGLVLATALSKKHDIVAYDINTRRINELNSGYDRNGIFDNDDLTTTNITFTSDIKLTENSDIFFIATDTSFENRAPKTQSVKDAILSIRDYLKLDTIVSIVSTIDIDTFHELETLVPNIGYTYARFDVHRLSDIVQVIAAKNETVRTKLKHVFSNIGYKVFTTDDINAAIIAKLFENAQRAANVAFMNEISQLCSKMNISFENVYHIATTKWNFANFRPGLVGGTCIPMSVQYLIYMAQKASYKPYLLEMTNKINTNTITYVANQIAKHVYRNVPSIEPKRKVLILGATYKPNTKMVKMSPILELAKLLVNYGFDVHIYDEHSYEMHDYTVSKPNIGFYDVIIIAVAHNDNRCVSPTKLSNYLSDDGLRFVFDLTGYNSHLQNATSFKFYTILN